MKDDVQKRIEETLNSLDGMQRAEASPFLYSKIQTRLQSAVDFVPQKLAWQMIAVLFIVAFLNVLTLFGFSDDRKRNDSGAESVANEYSITLPQTY